MILSKPLTMSGTFSLVRVAVRYRQSSPLFELLFTYCMIFMAYRKQKVLKSYLRSMSSAHSTSLLK